MTGVCELCERLIELTPAEFLAGKKKWCRQCYASGMVGFGKRLLKDERRSDDNAKIARVEA